MFIRQSVSISLLICGLTFGHAGAVVYPTAYDIDYSYSLDESVIAVSDTFTISRTLYNQEDFSLSGLYFSDNLPSEISIVDQSINVNGHGIPHLTIGPISGLIDGDHDTYYWIVDSMGAHEGIDHQIDSGDQVVLILKLVCDTVGQFTLPVHTTVFLGGDIGFFATSDPVELIVTPTVHIPDSSHDPVPASWLISKAYPNPFNPMVTISYSGQAIAGSSMELSIFDLTGRVIKSFDFTAGSDAGMVSWRPDESLNSGVYLYCITHQNKSSGGKLILLK